MLRLVSKLQLSSRVIRLSTIVSNGSCLQLRCKSTSNPREQSDEDIIKSIKNGDFPVHRLENVLGDAKRAAQIRRQIAQVEDSLPLEQFDYKTFYQSIEGANCEAVIGYVPIPVGVVQPLKMNDYEYKVPIATTEGALIASTNRGARAVFKSDGIFSSILSNGMTRAPLLRVPTVKMACDIKSWIEQPTNFQRVKDAFETTTRFGKLKNIKCYIAGRNLFLRFSCFTGDAMGMNMVTKGTLQALSEIQGQFPDVEVVSLSGNVCSDKKPAAINWVEGRGRSVVAEVIIPDHVLQTVLKTNADDMVNVNINKNLVGSAVAGSLGGFNAHAANIVAGLFLATGNDIAQTVESSQCITLIEKVDGGIHASVSMPCIEVGTVGGGTSLAAQSACLDLIGCRGSSSQQPGSNSDTLAKVTASTVLCAELSLLAALATNDLVKSHLALNRK